MTNSPTSALEREIEETRQRLANTIDDLVVRAHPKSIISREVDQIKGFFFDSATGAPRTENIALVVGSVVGVVGTFVVARKLFKR